MLANKAMAGWLLAATAGVAQAGTVTVTSLADTAGTCPSAGTCTLRAAIAAALPGDTVDFSPALGPGTITLATSDLPINKDLSIVGPGAHRLAVDAASSQRVLNVTAGVVSIEGLALVDGDARGGNGLNAPNGGGDNAQSGMPVEGGCVRVANGATLTLQRVALRDCQARGGDGGIGGTGDPAGVNSTARGGGDGGDGGLARGGAIASFGLLVLSQVSFFNASAQGGAGGRGGNGATPQFGNGGTGGTGGNAGVSEGGAIYLGSGSALLATNVTFAGGVLIGASGGRGGDGAPGGVGGSTGLAGVGGNGGAASGGNLYAAATISGAGADVEFATLGPVALSIGLGGLGGAGGAAPGTAGVLGAEGIAAFGAVRVRSSVITGSDGRLDCTGAISASGANLDSDSSCTGFTLHATFAQTLAGPAPTEETGLAQLPPLAGGPAIDAAIDCLDLDGTPVSVDQRGRARPIDGNATGGAQCDLGAVEFDLRLFRDGFE